MGIELLLGFVKDSLRLELCLSEIMHWELRLLTSRTIAECCDEEELKTIGHLLCNWRSLSKLRLKTLAGVSLRV